MRLHVKGGMANSNMVTAAGSSNLVRSLYRAWLRVRLRLAIHDLTRLRIEELNGLSIVVLPNVFNGVLVRTGAFLAETLDAATIAKGARVLDLGTGSGLGALAVAPRAEHVIATDINPEAVRCARINALLNHLDHKIELRLGDLFEPVRDERFDLILFNPPYYHGEPRDLSDHAWRSVDTFERFLRELPAHLTQGGCALVVLSTDGEIADALTGAVHLTTTIIRQRDFLNEVLTVYQIRVNRDTA